MVPLRDPNDSEDELLLILLAYRQIIRRKRRVKKTPRFWVNDYLKERRNKGRFYVDFPDMLKNPSIFRENYRFSPEQFRLLHGLVSTKLTPNTNKIRGDHIPAEEKLAVTLEYLASGDLLRHLGSTYRISKQRLGEIIEETCTAIIQTLEHEYMPKFSVNYWLETAARFQMRWNFPNCLGSLDGKHCGIKCPKDSGTAFYNYKGYFSVVLMAIADADYKFIYYDVGAYGSEGDSGVFRDCEFGKALHAGTLKLPFPRVINGITTPYFFVADDAFPLDRHIQKPYKPAKANRGLVYPERIFNYRLSRARRTIENAFGILCARWMCLARTIMLGPDRAQKVIACCCLLHNFLMTEGRDEYAPLGFIDCETETGTVVDGHWRTVIPTGSLFHNDMETRPAGRPSEPAKDVRKHLTNFFLTNEGKVDWQDNAIFYTTQ